MEKELQQLRESLIKERRLREEEQQKTRKTNLPEFLDACYVHLFLGLQIQKNSTLSTRCEPTNAKNKRRPDKILFWKKFPDLQNADQKVSLVGSAHVSVW